MQVAPINQDNRSFQALHVTKRALKAMGTTRRALLKNPAIMNAADKYEVLVKPAKNTHMKKTQRFSKTDIYCLFSIAFFAIAFSGLALGEIVSFLGLFGMLLSALFWCLSLLHSDDDGDVIKANNLLVQAGERFENGNLAGNKTEVYELTSPKDSLPDILNELYKKNENTKLETTGAGNLYTAKDYLAMVKNVIHDKSTFSKKIEGSGDTLLTRFFDVTPDEKRIAYRQIIDILKNIEGLDYNQKDDAEIPCLEKIINSQHIEALELVKDFEFNYTPELDCAFKNIENQKFKKQVSKLNIKFNEIIEAVKIKSEKALKELEGQLDSPLCNRKKLARDINRVLKEMKDPDYERWFKCIYLKYLNEGESNLID